MPNAWQNRIWRLGLWIAYRLLRIYWFVFRPQHHGALTAVWYEGSVLIIQNSYRSGLMLPGGSVQQRETSAQAAVRELAEETGITANTGDLHYVCDIQSTFTGQRDRISFFELQLNTSPEIHLDYREVIHSCFMSPKQALSQALVPPVREYLENIETNAD